MEYFLAAMMHRFNGLPILSALALANVLLLTRARNAQVPCDFKGVSMGDRLSREQLMQHFGVSKFKIDPPPESVSTRGGTLWW
jgi:hypothetical protein